MTPQYNQDGTPKNADRQPSLSPGVLHTMIVTRLQVTVVALVVLGTTAAGPLAADQARKSAMLRRGGGNAASEAAVATGLQWLAKQQTAGGHWSFDGNTKNDHAATALALLPFLGAGITHQSKDEPFAKNVQRGLQYLVSRQEKDGRLGAEMYTHAIATMALCHAHGLSGDAMLREPAQRALDFIVKAQHTIGGWRYVPGTPGDTSVTGWQVQALRLGQLAGLKVPRETFDRAGNYLDTVQATDGGYGYIIPKSTPTMTAAGLLCRQYTGWSDRKASFGAGLATLRQTAPATSNNLYHEYYATQVMFLAGGKHWQEWNAKIRDDLVKRQEPGNKPDTVQHKGSWSPAGDRFSLNSRLLATSFALQILEVYYRTDLLLAERAPWNVEELWNGLTAEDALLARQSSWGLFGLPRQAVPFLDERLQHEKPAPAADQKRIGQLIRDLDSDDFAVREKATQELGKMVAAVEAQLRQELDGKPSLDVRRRIEKLLEKHEATVAGERARTLRALEVLEHVNTPESRQVLQRLAKGPAGAWLTREAKAALERSAKR